MKYHNYKGENRKLILKYEKPISKELYNQIKLKYNLNNLNYINNKKKNPQSKINYTPIKTYNNINNNFFKQKNNNEIQKTTPIKYQYRKIPFSKLKGFKFKLPNNILKNQIKKIDINYPLICGHNATAIQSNLNNNIDTKKEVINNNNNDVNKDNKKLKPIYHLIDGKSSSLGSKYETREESAHFMRSKSSLNNSNYNRNEKKDINTALLKYINKAIKQLNKIREIIIDNTDKSIKINNKSIKIDLSKMGHNLEKYKNIIDIDKNKINLSFKKNKNHRKNQTIDINDYNYKNKKEFTLKKLNRTITYDNLKLNVKKGQKMMNINEKSFKNFKKLNINRNMIEYGKRFNTIEDIDNYRNKRKKNEYRIKNFDTEIRIPKLDINFAINNDNNKNQLKDRYKNDNEGESDNTAKNLNINNEADIANFEFSD